MWPGVYGARQSAVRAVAFANRQQRLCHHKDQNWISQPRKRCVVQEAVPDVDHLDIVAPGRSRPQSDDDTFNGARLAAVVVAAAFGISSASVRASRCEAVDSNRVHGGGTFRRLKIVRTQKNSSERLKELPCVALGCDESGGSQNPSIFVSVYSHTGHPLLGFGGSFTEASAHALGKMPVERREELLNAYFDPDHGLGYTIGRIPMGSCDFGLGNWTCGDLLKEERDLKGFSINRYESSGMLPMIRRASALAGAPIRLLASPWSPPPWMKTKPKFEGDAHLLAEYRDTWASHFARFVAEMNRSGIPIWGVSVQNEPEAAQVWESCIYSAAEETVFIRDHLGPTLEKADLGDVKILFWDHNRDGMFERAALTYADPNAAKYIYGMCFHWYGDPRYESWPPRHEVPYSDRQKNGKPIFELKGCAGFENVRRVADLRPDKHLLFSEGCQELGGRPLKDLLGEWKLGERYASNIVNDLNSGCEGFIDWNLCLDGEGGPNHVGNNCSAPVICDATSGRLLYQPSFWYIGHFSKFIRPGAVRVLSSTSRDALELTSFLNCDGSLVTVVMNHSNQDVSPWFKVASGRSVVAAQVEVPARSIVTFIADGECSAAPSLWDRILPWVVRNWLWKSPVPWLRDN